MTIEAAITTPTCNHYLYETGFTQQALTEALEPRWRKSQEQS